MSRDTQKNRGKQEYRRLRWVMSIGVVFWVTLAGRLVQVQGIQHAEYAVRAREQYEREVELKAVRGNIFDCQGRELAVDVQTVSFYGDPVIIEHPDQVAQHFAGLGKQQDAVTLARQLRSSRRFVYLARQLDGEALAQARSHQFRGVFEHCETKRRYPYGGLAGQLLGHTSIDNRGSEGIELGFDAFLRETDGSALSYVDARGRQVPGLQKECKAPKNGGSLMLTIDAVYQGILEEELGWALKKSEAESGLGIIVHPKTGEILALANVPLYNPNDPGRGATRLRRNRTITDPFEPGSTFKVMAAAAVLEDGKATRDERIFCEEGQLTLDSGEVIRDIHPYGWLSFRQVLEKSSNVGIIKLARRLQRQRFYEYIRNFGFGTRSGIGLPAESAGLLSHVSKWSERSLETISIGQEISVTPLQLVQAFGAIANGGVLMEPRLLKAIIGPDGQVAKELSPQPVRRVVSEATAAELREILAGVIRNGTGHRAQIEGVEIAGKTGTAQRVAADGSGYDPDEYVVSFIGFLPADDPELLCLVVLDKPQRDKWGGQLAAPVFRRTMERILYLRDGLLTAGDQAAVLDTTVLPLPDLRGMTKKVARFQAELRGLSVAFSGVGNVVVGQAPAPGSIDRGVSRISAVLGTIADASLAEVRGIPLRQALLLQSMKGSRLAALR